MVTSPRRRKDDTVLPGPLAARWYIASTLLTSVLLGTSYFGVLFVLQMQWRSSFAYHALVYAFLILHNFTVSFIVVAVLNLRRAATTGDGLAIVGAANVLSVGWIGAVIGFLCLPSVNVVDAALGTALYALLYLAVPGCPGALVGALVATVFTRPRSVRRKAIPWTT